MRVTARGKSFLLDGSPFHFRGVRYQPEPTSSPLGEDDGLRHQLAAMAAAGYSVVSMPPPPSWTIDCARGSGLRFMLEANDPDLDRVGTASRHARNRLVRDFAMRLTRAVKAWHGSEALLGVVLTEPAALGRSRGGADAVCRAVDELAVALHDDEPSLLLAWRSGWPLRRECPPEFDFLIGEFAVCDREQLGPAVMACHCEVGDRPLVLGGAFQTPAEQGSEPGLSSVIETALWCGAAGTVTGTWSQRNATRYEPERAHLRRTVRDLPVRWPSISVVIAAYNAQATLDECLSHCDRLEYPTLELIVIDDGSTDATPAIARSHPEARLVSISHCGLAAARNTGYRCAHGELIVYLDPDAYPSPHWLWYMALAALGTGVGGCGGPNVPPPDDPLSARVVARSPGGPVPLLLSPDRAEHVPGCNMAFWRATLDKLNGFDPIFLGAADDVAFQLRLRESGDEIAFHPAALVWHRRRTGLGPYLRQQSRNGRSYAMLERRYPDRFPLGQRFRNATRRLRSRVSESDGAASCPVKYLTLARPETPILELAHQWGVPAAVVVGSSVPLGLMRRKLAAPAVAASAFVATLFVIDVVLAGKGRRRPDRTVELRVRVAAFRLLRPLAFRWGHLSGWHGARGAALHWPQPPDASSAANPAIGQRN